MKNVQQLQRHFKGIANHRRIEILLLTAKQDGIILDAIAQILKTNLKTISEHTRRLVHAGLLNKTYKGRIVTHSLSLYGKKMVAFIKTFQHS